MKILLATSSPHVLRNIKTTTGDAEVDIVETGEEIFQLLESNDYDCLITEINLMDIDVWSLARFVHSNIKQDFNKRLPIFVIEDKQI